jgi:hypothetical protein
VALLRGIFRDRKTGWLIVWSVRERVSLAFSEHSPKPF